MPAPRLSSRPPCLELQSCSANQLPKVEARAAFGCACATLAISSPMQPQVSHSRAFPLLAWISMAADSANGAFANSPAKPPALPERIEAVLRLREKSIEVIGSPWGTARALKEITMS